MPKIQLVLTDFDGTVAQLGKHIVSEKVREAVIACEEKGIRMVPVTGRYYEMAQPVLKILGFEDLGIFDNGASIRNCETGELVWSQWLDANTVRRVASVLAPVSRIMDYSPEHDVHEPADNELEHIALVDQDTSHVYGLVRLEDVEATRRQLSVIPGITFYTAPSTEDHITDCLGFQVNHHMANKFHGVAALRSIIGIAKEHTLAIGDGDNDISLFQNAKYKIAMGNATDALKAQADYVVSTVDQDGFAEAMDKFVLEFI